MAESQELPPTLIDLLSNAIIFRQTIPYLPIKSLLRLGATCKLTRQLLYSQPDAWKYLDLSPVKRAMIDSSPIDVGGTNWRSQRMDEALCEDDFYAGPLRGIFGSLNQKMLLQHVQTLILDGLSVPADLIHEILIEDRYRVRVLSIRKAKNLNQSKLQQTLRYAVRPTRAKGTPKLRALYFFGPKETPRHLAQLSDRAEELQSLGVMSSRGAQIGAQWNQKSSSALTSHLSDEQTTWYGNTGRAIPRPLSDWPETLHACRGLISFDAVLCRGPRHDITKVSSKDFLQPTIATVALGPAGCEICHSMPEQPARFGDCEDSALPLLGPAPSHSSVLRAALRPEALKDGSFPNLFLRCEDCLRSRWCEQCNRFWCEDCYKEPVSRLQNQGDLHPSEVRELVSPGEAMPTTNEQSGSTPVKIGVHRDCWACGRTCETCKGHLIKSCRNCRTEFCRPHDEGCSATECGWCNSSGRRTRELY